VTLSSIEFENTIFILFLQLIGDFLKNDLYLSVCMIPRQCRLPLVKILRITFFIIWVLCPFGRVKNELSDRHTSVDFYRTRVDICHLKRDGSPETGIDPASGLVQGNAESGDTRFPFNRGNNIIRQPDALQCFRKDKLARIKDECICVHLFYTSSYAVLVVGVDDLVIFRIPDKMVSKTDIQRVGLHQLRVEGVNVDIAPGDAVQELPVHQNHCGNMVGGD